MHVRYVSLIALLLAPCAIAQKVDFHTQVVPILQKHCYECHGGNESKGGFSINTRGLMLDADAFEAGNAAESYLIELVTDDDPDFQMPPEDKPRVSKQEIDTLRQWIDQGADWEEGFTFAISSYEPPLRPRRPELPDATDGRDHPIDRIIDSYQVEHDVERQPGLSDEAFLRRASLDLIGIMPEQSVIDRFLADESEDKRQKFIDQLLADDVDYARHWLTFWNDLLRNDYKGTGYITGGRRSISNWLYTSLLENKPYDTFTHQLIAPTGESDGFITGIKWRGEVNASQTPEIQFSQNVGQVFLGINLKCASCHDSFIDRWTLEEAYNLASIVSDEPLELYRCDKPTGRMSKPAWIFPELGEIDATLPKAQRLKQLADLMVDPENGRHSRTVVNRLWHQMMGRGVVHPIDAMRTEPWSEDLLDYLAIYLIDNDYDLKAVLQHIATSQAYQQRSHAYLEEPESEDYVFEGPLIKRMSAEQLVDMIRQVTETQTTKSDLPIDKLEKGYDSADKLTRASMLASDPLQRALGRPNREQVVTNRPSQLTPLQALDLANGQQVSVLVRDGAKKLIQAHGEKGINHVIGLVYRRALMREPTPRELAICRRLIGDELSQEGLEDMLWSVFMLPEFQHIR